MSESQSVEIAAVGFLVMAFTDEDAAGETLKLMKDAKKHKEFYFEDAAVVRQDAEGKVHYHETGDMHTGKGAGIGALIGGVLGILGGPAGVALGAGAGAAIGGAAAHGDAGFRDESLEAVGVALKPGTSAVAAITSHAFLRAVQKQVPVEDVRGAVHNLSTEISSRLEQGQSMALGIILAEEGLAVKEVAVGEDYAEIFGVVATDEGVAAGAALVTTDEVDYEVGVATEKGVFFEAGTITDDEAVIVDYVEAGKEPEEGESAEEEDNDQEADAGDDESTAEAVDAG
jgi:uncharacterized membrane protein